MRRRNLLKVLGAGALVAACGEDDPAGADGGGGQGGGGSSSGQGGSGGVVEPTPAANVSDLVDGGLLAVPIPQIYLGLDAGGVYAMTSLCSHKKCNMLTQGAMLAAGLHCNCHGSEFDLNGQVTHGPAVAELVHYAVDIDDVGDIWVDKSMLVASDVRTPLPA